MYQTNRTWLLLNTWMDRIELLDPAHSYLPSHASWEAIWTSEGHYLEYRYMAVSQTTKLMENVNTVHSVIRVGKISFILLVRYAHIVLIRLTTICHMRLVQINMTPMVFCHIPYVSICGQTLVTYVEYCRMYLDDLHLFTGHFSTPFQPGEPALRPPFTAPSAPWWTF